MSTALPSIGVDIGLLPNICQHIHDVVNRQENSNIELFVSFKRKNKLHFLSIVSNRISRLYPKFSESSSSSSVSHSVGLQEFFQAANLCLEKRLQFHSMSDENFAKLKLALEQMHTTIERTEQVHKTLDHLEHLPKHIKSYDNEQQQQQDIKTPFDNIATKFYSAIDCGQQARELFREQMSKQTPNSFVTCCNTIATLSADDSNSDFMHDDTTIIRCQIPTNLSAKAQHLQTVIEAPPTSDERMLKGLECLLLNESSVIQAPQPTTTATTTTTKDDNDESFLTLEQQCKMDSDVFMDIPQPDMEPIQNNFDDPMEEDYFEKENVIPIEQQQQQQQQPQINNLKLDPFDENIQFISPIISVPIEQ